MDKKSKTLSTTTEEVKPTNSHKEQEMSLVMGNRTPSAKDLNNNSSRSRSSLLNSSHSHPQSNCLKGQ